MRAMDGFNVIATRRWAAAKSAANGATAPYSIATLPRTRVSLLAARAIEVAATE